MREENIDLKSILTVDDMGGMDEVFMTGAKDDSWHSLIHDF
jgi:hypothetical protein